MSWSLGLPTIYCIVLLCLYLYLTLVLSRPTLPCSHCALDFMRLKRRRGDVEEEPRRVVQPRECLSLFRCSLWKCNRNIECPKVSSVGRCKYCLASTDIGRRIHSVIICLYNVMSLTFKYLANDLTKYKITCEN